MAAKTLAALAREVAELRARVTQLEHALRSPGRRDEAGEPVPGSGSHADHVAAMLPAAVASPAEIVAGSAPPPAPLAEAHALLTAIFACVVHRPDDDDEACAAFAALVHADRKGTPLLDEDLRAYKWRPLLQRHRQYLEHHDDPASFRVVRCQPEQPDAETAVLKLFLFADKRMPTPVILRRDPDARGAWRLDVSSL